MESEEVRRGFTLRGFGAFDPWIEEEYIYTISQINLGSNFIAKLEVVSALNSFNIAYQMFAYHYLNRTKKYNPKLYLGTIQTASTQWNYDYQDPQKIHPFWVSDGLQKSGSWPQKLQSWFKIFLKKIIRLLH